MQHEEQVSTGDLLRQLDTAQREVVVAHAFIMHSGQWAKFLQPDWQTAIFAGGRVKAERYSSDVTPEKLLEAAPVKKPHKVT